MYVAWQPLLTHSLLSHALQIYNNVAAGFTDANPYLRELTLKSMAVLGPKLSQKTLSQSLLKHLAKLQARDAHRTATSGLCEQSARRARCMPSERIASHHPAWQCGLHPLLTATGLLGRVPPLPVCCLLLVCRWMRRHPSELTPLCCWATWPLTCRVSGVHAYHISNVGSLVLLCNACKECVQATAFQWHLQLQACWHLSGGSSPPNNCFQQRRGHLPKGAAQCLHPCAA